MRALGASRTSLVPGGVLAGPWVRDPLWRIARAVPSLDLRFADNKSLTDAVTGASLVTFTRASSGTFVDSAGVIQTAATDVPRFDHDPTTGESLGLLVEEQRTNLLVRSEEFETTWDASNLTVSANTADTAAPTGLFTADKITGSSSTSNIKRISQSVTLSAIAYTFTVYAKANDQNFLQLRTFTDFGAIFANFDISNGAVGNSSGVAAANTQAVGNGWYRCRITFTPSAATSSVSLNFITALTSPGPQNTTLTTSLYLWGAQLEAGAFPTSYIPTTTATVTRSADVASISGSNFSSWYRQDEGTVFSDCVGTHSATQILVNIGATAANTGSSSIAIASNLGSSQKRVRVRDAASADQASFALGASSSGSRTRIAAAIKADDFAASLDGGAAVTDTTGTVPTVALMEIGSAPSGVNLGTQLHRRLTYWPQRLANSTLQAVTQ